MNPLAKASLAGAATIAGAWTAVLTADRRRVRRDDAQAILDAPLNGRPLAVCSADGTALHAEVFGPEDAPTIVLAHGWTCALGFWTCQIQELGRDLRVVAYDLRGHGRSARAAGGDYSIDAHAADLDAVLRAAVPDGPPPVVAGHSLGAMTIVAWAGAHAATVSDRIAAAALLNTGVGDLITESLILRAPDRLGEIRHVLGRALLSASAPLPRGTTPVSHRLVRYIALSAQATPAQVAFSERLVLGCPRDVRAACGGALTKLDLYEAVRELTVPTVVVAGENDRLTPVSHARRLAETLPQLEELIVLPGSGHMGPVTEPDIVNARLRALVAGTRAGASLAA